MSARITISAERVTLAAELNDSQTSRAILDALPITGKALRWGEEVYFETPVAVEQSDNAREEMAVGEIGYWPVGRAICIFFGPTPASDSGGAPRAASPVNPIGKTVDDATALKAIAAGTKITVSSEQA